MKLLPIILLIVLSGCEPIGSGPSQPQSCCEELYPQAPGVSDDRARADCELAASLGAGPCAQ